MPHELRRRASDQSRTEKIAANATLTVYARVASALVSTFAVPFLVWMVTTLYQHQTELAVITSGTIEYDRRITSLETTQYRALDASRDFAVMDRRVDKTERDIRDLSTRIDILQNRKE